MMKWMIGSLALAILCAPLLFAQMTAEQKPAGMADCAAMMQKNKDMQSHMTEMNAKLQTLVDDMNKAKGSAKTDKMAAVLTELVSQRSMMQKQMMEMQPAMMEHMMEHMKSMPDCPMMKKSEKAAATPST